MSFKARLLNLATYFAISFDCWARAVWALFTNSTNRMAKARMTISSLYVAKAGTTSSGFGAHRHSKPRATIPD
jgi:hypothetical protein